MTARALLAAGAATAPLALAAGDAERAVVVRDEAGEEIVRASLPANEAFGLAYRHSVYGAPARERFAADEDGGGFRLRSLASPRAAVLDYYALAGRRTRAGAWLRLVPHERRRYERLPLIATATGRRTLLVGERRFPLYGRSARHLTVSVEEGS
jgi:Domain of unknown function (DUF1850)